jgi:hypothetical protein
MTSRPAECAVRIAFPAQVTNRPALPRITFRIGAYSDIRASLLRALDTTPLLEPMTYRGADDPAIALLEGAALLGDILTFYQELYANEAFLRTSAWRSSVGDLTRLIGYRLTPGLGGRAAFIVEVQGDAPVNVPMGFPVRADLAALEATADFQTTEALTAYPWFSRFRLYRPTVPAGLKGKPATELMLFPAGPNDDPVAVAKGDRLLVGVGATSPPFQMDSSSIVVVDGVRSQWGVTFVTLRGSLPDPGADSLVGMRVGRTFSHFGYNAPPKSPDLDASPPTWNEISYVRNLVGDTGATTAVNNPAMIPLSSSTLSSKTVKWLRATLIETDVTPGLTATDFPLDVKVQDLALGGLIVVRSVVFESGGDKVNPFVGAAIRTIAYLGARTQQWGSLSAASTLVTVDSMIGGSSADIRALELHEVIGSPFLIQAVPAPSTEAHGTSLNFFGTADEAKALAQRTLSIPAPDGDVLATVTDVGASLSRWGTTRPALYPITLDTEVDYALFPADGGGLVFGNIVHATQGKGGRERLGDGDARKTFQTFKLNRSPLTWLRHEGLTPPERPELEVWVGIREWMYVSTLYGRGPADEVFVVRQDADGASYVQFGDGKTGARLPSGVGNVAAVYRSGIGAHGPLKPRTAPTPGGRIDALKALGMSRVATDGALPESIDDAKEAAPGRVVSLGRLVTLEDYEYEALAIPGVSAARATWEVVDNAPAVVVTVIHASGRDAEIASVQRSLALADRCRGSRRNRLIVRQGEFEWVDLEAVFAAQPGLDPGALLDAVTAALGVTGREADGVDGSRGLFALATRRFGEAEFASRVEGTIQDVDGVVWAQVTSFGSLGVADDPKSLTPPPPPRALAARVGCADDRILRLFAGGADGPLRLTIAAAPAGVCDG